MTQLKGLPPILPKEPRALILGSMPSARSLAERRYYAHPRNLFWTLLAEVAGGAPPPAEYAEKVAAAKRAGIAVWDVLAECRRRGSADAAIARDSERANDIGGLLSRFPSLRAVALNGGKARECFARHVKVAPPNVLFLPSTSPANAGMTRAQKAAAWRQIAPFLRVSRARPAAE